MTHIDLDDIQRIALPVLILLPIAASAMVGLLIMASSRYPSALSTSEIVNATSSMRVAVRSLG